MENIKPKILAIIWKHDIKNECKQLIFISNSFNR